MKMVLLIANKKKANCSVSLETKRVSNNLKEQNKKGLSSDNLDDTGGVLKPLRQNLKNPEKW